MTDDEATHYAKKATWAGSHYRQDVPALLADRAARIECEAALVAALRAAVVALDLILSLDGLVCICADDDGTDRADCALHGTVGAHAALSLAAAVGVTPRSP